MSGQRDTALRATVLNQPSGLAMSSVNPHIAYIHSEKDDHGMLAVDTRDAQVVARYQVEIPQQWDWEDIAVGPCSTGSCIFAGDIGRSNGKPNPPSTFSVLRIPEPDLSASTVDGWLTGDSWRFQYPDGPHNAEALMVHPVSGEVYVITKEQSGRSGVYTLPTGAPPVAGEVVTLSKVATLAVPVWTGEPDDVHSAMWYAQVTAAAIHPSGERFIVRTPLKVWEYRAQKCGPFASAFAARPVSLTAPTAEGQGEAIDYAPDGSAYFTISESPEPPFILKRVDRR